MIARDHTALLAELRQAYSRHAPKSGAINERANEYLVDGGSHAVRLMEPFPPRIAEAHGAWLTDEDGHQILDFWQGHLGNILGHNPPVVTEVLADNFANGLGLQTGFTDRLQAETAEILCRQTGSDQVRFTTSGTLATMYAILLARSFTGRDVVMKVGGGWHGAHPWGLKGIRFHGNDGGGFAKVDSDGLACVQTDEIVITRYNDTDMLADCFRQYGDRLACFIVEPFIGMGGMMPASREYLQTARELTAKCGAVLVFDEVIAGFRFRAGNAGALYGLQPDLASFGKVIGGGMPVAALGGRSDIMRLAGREANNRVKFSGGTYSAHPASLLAAKTQMEYLVAHEHEVYPRLAVLGEKSRRLVEAAYAEEGILARCTGNLNGALLGSSLSMVVFPYRDDCRLEYPDDIWDPTVTDVVLRETVVRVAMLLEDVNTVHGLGSVSTAHSEADIDRLAEACRCTARRIKA